MSSRRRDDAPPKRDGYAPFSFWLVTVVLILVVIALIIMIILYFTTQTNLIDPANCPEKIEGIVVTPDSRIATLASNCGSNPNCTFTVGSIAEAVQICSNIGNVKCAAFSLEQQTDSDNFTLTISESTDVIAEIGVDSLRIIT